MPSTELRGFLIKNWMICLTIGANGSSAVPRPILIFTPDFPHLMGEKY